MMNNYRRIVVKKARGGMKVVKEDGRVLYYQSSQWMIKIGMRSGLQRKGKHAISSAQRNNDALFLDWYFGGMINKEELRAIG